MPTLNWIGKEAVVNHRLQVPESAALCLISVRNKNLHDSLFHDREDMLQDL